MEGFIRVILKGVSGEAYNIGNPNPEISVQELAEIFKRIPNNRILIETDSPYLAPEPKRGKSNEPSYLVFTLSFISKIKNLPDTEFAKITTNNFYNLFGKIF